MEYYSDIDIIEDIKQFCIDQNYRVEVVGKFVNLARLFKSESMSMTTAVKQYFGEDAYCIVVPQMLSQNKSNDIFDDNIMVLYNHRNYCHNEACYYFYINVKEFIKKEQEEFMNFKEAQC